MLFQINQVQSGIDKIYEVPLVFFENANLAHTCDKSLFPKWFQPVYKRCPGVKEQFHCVFKIFKRLSKTKQREIVDLYRASRDIKKICSDRSNNYPLVSKFDDKTQEALKSLFEFLFNSTLGTDIFKRASGMHIDDHYAEFQKKNNIHVCPFCGLETYTLPKARRAEYDHFLPISIYPWLGVNLNNLVPMGDHCNGKKNKANILYADEPATIRREAWYPYEWINHSIALNNKTKPSITEMKGKWEVVIKATSTTNDEKVRTWNDVFEISSRYEETISSFHKRFIEDLAHKNNLKGQRLSIAKLKEELRIYRDQRIGDVKLEPLAKLKFIWANYHIRTSDTSQLAVIAYTISYLNSRVRP